MILVDKNIKERVESDKLIAVNYNENNVNCVSYDLSVDKILINDKSSKNSYNIKPNETVFVKTKEMINMPYDLVGIVTEKNSRMRQGLKVDAPRYQPGHSTFVFLRVQNISNQIILIEENTKIAQIMFETLYEEPSVTYDRQINASFNDEQEYIGFGNYEAEYIKQIKDVDETIEKAKEDIDTMSHKIYSNVLALMGIIVAIFSLITINYNAATQSDLNFKFIVAMNLSLAFCIVLMMGLIFIFLNTKKHKSLWIIYLIVFILLAIAVVSFCIFMF
ncbi:MAG: hypothetical protein J1E85_02185 [Ruminococcus sp.]|nr:hypothetical protein [Ruminococcus sp.]